MSNKIEIPFDLTVLPEMTEEQKDEMVLEAVKSAGACLLLAFLVCEVPNYIDGSFEDAEGNQYELLFRRKRGPATHA